MAVAWEGTQQLHRHLPQCLFSCLTMPIVSAGLLVPCGKLTTPPPLLAAALKAVGILCSHSPLPVTKKPYYPLFPRNGCPKWQLAACPLLSLLPLSACNPAPAPAHPLACSLAPSPPPFVPLEVVQQQHTGKEYQQGTGTPTTTPPSPLAVPPLALFL